MNKQKITPIRKKGCKNVGWIWDQKHETRLIVPIKPSEKCVFVTEWTQLETADQPHKSKLMQLLSRFFR